jgi:hypothetical protein
MGSPKSAGARVCWNDAGASMNGHPSIDFSLRASKAVDPASPGAPARKLPAGTDVPVPSVWVRSRARPRESSPGAVVMTRLRQCASVWGHSAQPPSAEWPRATPSFCPHGTTNARARNCPSRAPEEERLSDGPPGSSSTRLSPFSSGPLTLSRVTWPRAPRARCRRSPGTAAVHSSRSSRSMYEPKP